MSPRMLLESFIPVVRLYGLNTEMDAVFGGNLTTSGFIDKGSQMFDIRAYDASTGSSDNREAILDAVSAAEAVNGAVFIPAGVWYTSADINIPSNVSLVGSGSGSVLKLVDSYGFEDNIIKVESTSNTVIGNLVIDGNRVNQAPSSSKTIGSVNTGTDVITITSHGLSTGDAVNYIAGTTAIGGLTDRTIYYVIRVDANTLKLALTEYAAYVTGTAIDLTSSGSGTHTLGVEYQFTQFGLYFGSTENCKAFNIITRNTTGVGFHSYDNDGLLTSNIHSTGNRYHGYEFEQSRTCETNNILASLNDGIGLLVSPGEIGGTGSRDNTFTNVTCSFNGNGVELNAANGDISPFLCEGNKFTGLSVTDNAYRGINLYKQDKSIFSNAYIARNGQFGVYGYQTQYNQFSDILTRNNSQAGNGSYDEIMFEGDTGHYSTNNTVNGIVSIINGAVKSRYAINEASANDGSNTYTNIEIPDAGTSGRYSIQTTSTLSSRAAGLSVASNATLGTNQMGVDAPFGTAALRMYNSNSGGNLQFVSPNGNSDWYAGGNNTFSVTSTQAIAQNKLLALAGSATSVYAKVGGTIFTYNTDVGNSGTSETDLYTDSMPANLLSTNKDRIQARYAGEMVNSATATRQVKVYFGGSSIFDSGALALSAASDWDIDILIIRVSSSVVRYSVKLGLTGAPLSLYTSVGELTGLTLGNANILKITGTAAGVGAATNDIVAKLGTVEWKSAP